MSVLPPCVVLILSCLCADVKSIQAESQIYSELEMENAFAKTLQQDNTEQTCHLSGAMEVCQAAHLVKGEHTDFFHLCPSDGDPCNPNLCYYTSIPPCCPGNPLRSCNSTSKLFVGGQTVDVAFYNIPRLGFPDQVCFKVSSGPSPLEACDCGLECIKVGPECLNNTKHCDQDGNCECKPEYKLPDCCNCADDNATHGYYKKEGECQPFCREHCIGRRPNSNLPCTQCRGGFVPPECCECEEGLTEINKVCKCEKNTDNFGNCKPGYIPPKCCECDITGNDTHAFYMNDNKECTPFCKKNCQTLNRDGKGCETCKLGYEGAPECCQCAEGFEVQNNECVKEEGCNKAQNIYFLLDATRSNELNQFCEMMTSVQILTAALSRTSRFYAVLFPHDFEDDDPNTVFDFSNSCDSIVTGATGMMPSLIGEFRKCIEHDSSVYPSMCGDSTLAVPGLEKIEKIADKETGDRRQAVIMITDGIIQDLDNDIRIVTTNLQRKGVSAIIAGAISSELPEEFLRKYTLGVSENAIVRNDPVDLVTAIVRRLEAAQIICEKEANDVRDSISELRKRGSLERDLYCACVPNTGMCYHFNIKSYTSPTCGGTPLNVGMDFDSGARAENLEDEIVAAVEDVLENYMD